MAANGRSGPLVSVSSNIKRNCVWRRPFVMWDERWDSQIKNARSAGSSWRTGALVLQLGT